MKKLTDLASETTKIEGAKVEATEFKKELDALVSKHANDSNWSQIDRVLKSTAKPTNEGQVNEGEVSESHKGISIFDNYMSFEFHNEELAKENLETMNRNEYTQGAELGKDKKSITIPSFAVARYYANNMFTGIKES
jgi:hypothetical protein